MDKFTPTEEQLLELIQRIKSENPSFGLARISSEVKARKKDWSVSEKRIKKVLQVSSRPLDFWKTWSMETFSVWNFTLLERLETLELLFCKVFHRSRPR